MNGMARFMMVLAGILSLSACAPMPDAMPRVTALPSSATAASAPMATPRKTRPRSDVAYLFGDVPPVGVMDNIAVALMPRRKVVVKDVGGWLHERYREIELLKAAGTRVEIKGRCISACTLYLALENTCIHPDATLGFHGAGRTDEKDNLHLSRANLKMSMHYKPDLQAWFLAEASKLRGKDYIVRSGSEIIAMGYKSCVAA